MQDNATKQEWIEPTIDALDIDETSSFFRRGVDGGFSIDSTRS